MVNNFLDYLFKSILEAAEGDELPVYFSDSFRELLQDIQDDTNNEIATRLLYEEGKSSKRVFIDIDQDSNDKVSFIMANKSEEILGRRDNIKYLSHSDHDKVFKSRQRGTMKINRFINDLFNNEYQTQPLTPEQRKTNKEKGIKTAAQHLEDFVNQFKAIRDPGEFVLVKGSEIVHWYSEDQYENGNGTLGGSCMMYEECQEFIEFYAYNQHKISLLIMKSKDNKSNIVGRALVWKLDTPSGKTFMDRIYTNFDYDVENFKKYAKDHGWLYKWKQNSDSSEQIANPQNDQHSKMSLVVNGISPYEENETYPYLDTLKYYSPSLKIISNREDSLKGTEYYVLEGTNGDDYEVIEVRTLEELKELYHDDIMDNIREYANMYPNLYWKHIDDEDFIVDQKDSERDRYSDELEHMIDDPSVLIRFIKKHAEDDHLPKKIKELDLNGLYSLLDELDLRDELVDELLDKRYDDSTAKEVIKDMFGNTDNITLDILYATEDYLDVDEFAEEISEDADEEYLREKYPEDEY